MSETYAEVAPVQSYRNNRPRPLRALAVPILGAALCLTLAWIGLLMYGAYWLLFV